MQDDAILWGDGGGGFCKHVENIGEGATVTPQLGSSRLQQRHRHVTASKEIYQQLSCAYHRTGWCGEGVMFEQRRRGGGHWKNGGDWPRGFPTNTVSLHPPPPGHAFGPIPFLTLNNGK